MRSRKISRLIFFRRSRMKMRILASGFLKSLYPKGDDDFVDRLNYYYTPLVLLVAATLVSAKDLISKPIQCWIPSHFTHSMEEYIEHYCWLQNTYYIPMYENIPDDLQTRDSKQIGYYQWVHFILIIEALLFALPCLVWRLTSWRSGMNLHYLVAAACDIHAIDGVEKKHALNEIASNLRNVIELQAGIARCTGKSAKSEDNSENRLSVSLAIRFLKICPYNGSYVTAMYLCTKFIYVANVVAQFFLLNAFLKSEEVHIYGFRVLIDVIYGRPWTESGYFPRVTLCDIEVRSVGNLNRYTVQCALIANMYNEKIFVFVWIWMTIVAVVTSASFVHCFFNCAISTQRMMFVLKYLRIAASQQSADKTSGRSCVYSAPSHIHDRFVDQYLGTDGVFALRMISNHAGDIVTMELVKRLWIAYKESYESEAVVQCIDLTDVGIGSPEIEKPGKCESKEADL